MVYKYKLPLTVELIRSHNTIFLKGPKGQLNIETIVKGLNITFYKKENCLISNKKIFLKKLLEKKIKGVLTGFKLELNLIGIGYRAYLENKCLNLRVGFSHPIIIPIPCNIEIFLEDEKTIILYSSNYELLSNFCAKLIHFRPINKFTGQGIQKKGAHYIKQKSKKK